jgi:ATP-binding cassette subfamily C protein
MRGFPVLYSPQAAQAEPPATLKDALAPCRNAFIGIFAMSALVNLLYLTGSFFMLEVYDRVLPSRSVPTLLALGFLALVLYCFQAALDLIRNRILVRIGAVMDQALTERVFEKALRMSLSPRAGLAQQPSQDLDTIRNFIGNGGPIAFFDLPWIPVYLLICFAFHYWIGITAIIGSVLLVVMTLLTERGTVGPTRAATSHLGRRNAVGEASRRNAEVLQALGMGPRMAAIWRRFNDDYAGNSARASDVALGYGSISRVMRLVLQSFTLALCAYLVINQLATAGVMIASSILVTRALAPIELAIAQWKHFIAARQSWKRLSELLAEGDAPQRLTLPPPRRQLSVENILLTAPGDERLIVRDVSFQLAAGSGLGIIGRSGCGKSSLARGLVGVWSPVRGSVRLDGASLDQRSHASLGQHIGYLPQSVELFTGTVAQNIARFDPEAPASAVIEAAKAADIHDLILRMPNGYDTHLGDTGMSLSGGQRQRIGLARALYGQPFLVVLDEPNSNLDGEGDAALNSAVIGIRARGGIVIVITHRPSALAGVDLVMTMSNGTMQAFGPKDDVLKGILKPSSPVTAAPPPLRVAAQAEV